MLSWKVKNDKNRHLYKFLVRINGLVIFQQIVDLLTSCGESEAGAEVFLTTRKE